MRTGGSLVVHMASGVRIEDLRVEDAQDLHEGAGGVIGSTRQMTVWAHAAPVVDPRKGFDGLTPWWWSSWRRTR